MSSSTTCPECNCRLGYNSDANYFFCTSNKCAFWIPCCEIHNLTQDPKKNANQQDNQTTTEPANELHTPITFGSFKNPYDVEFDQEDTSPSTKEDVATERFDVSNESGDDWTKVARKNNEQPRNAEQPRKVNRRINTNQEKTKAIPQDTPSPQSSTGSPPHKMSRNAWNLLCGSRSIWAVDRVRSGKSAATPGAPAAGAGAWEDEEEELEDADEAAGCSAVSFESGVLPFSYRGVILGA